MQISDERVRRAYDINAGKTGFTIKFVRDFMNEWEYTRMKLINSGKDLKKMRIKREKENNLDLMFCRVRREEKRNGK